MLCERHTGEAMGGKDTLKTEGAVWGNATGIVRGNWVRYTAGEMSIRELNLTEISPGIEWAFQGQEHWTRNITGREGKLMVRLDEREVEEITIVGAVAMKSDGTAMAVNETVREVAATLTIQDESTSGDGWEMRVHGVHWPKTGVLLMTTTSDKFAGIFGLPHLTGGRDGHLGMDEFTTSQRLLNQTLEKTIKRLEKSAWADPGNPWSANPDAQGDAIMPTPHCEFVVYAQVYPVVVDDPTRGKGYWDPQAAMKQIEDELRFPNGAPISEVPKLKMSTVIFSPDCGFILESKGPPEYAQDEGTHLVGMKQEEFLNGFQDWLHIQAVIVFGQTLLTKMQSKEASTPSTVGRVSLYTIMIMTMADTMIFAGLSFLSGAAPNLFPAALLTSFSALMSIALGMRFIGAIFNVQEPERRATQQAAETTANAARTNPTPAPAPIITAAGVDVPAQPPARPRSPPAIPRPPPLTTSNSNIPIIVPSDQDIDAEITENLVNAGASLLPITNTVPTTGNNPRAQAHTLASRTGKIAFGVLMLTLLTISSTSWPVGLRSFYINTLSFLYLSFWVPQIRRNIVRNCRKALLWKFVFGQSFLRLLPFAYFYAWEGNVLFIEQDWITLSVLVGWVWLQILVLGAQEIVGPRWGLPSNWYEEGWDYHPILREDEIESGGLPIGLIQGQTQDPASPTHTHSRSNSQDASQAQSKKSDHRSPSRTADCAICMQTLEVPLVPSGDDGKGAGGVQGMLETRRYMVTPCRHVFHSVCLEGWMRFRLQCPICREGLPPL